MDDYINKKFKFFVPVKKSEDAPDDGRLYLDGIASTTNKDYEDDKMEPEAIASMKNQALAGLTGFDGHDYSLPGIFGRIVAVKDTDSNTFHPVFRVLKSMEAKVNELLDDGVQLGLSIGGAITDYLFKGTTRIIKDLKLFEVSITPIPVVGDSLGTVGISDYQPTSKTGCPGPICSQIFKSVDTKYFDKSKSRKDKHKIVDKDMEDEYMKPEDITAIVDGVADKFKESNDLLLEGITETLKPAESPETPPEEEDDPEKANKPEFTKEQIVADAKAALIEELTAKEPETPPEDETKKAYKEVVNTLVKDVLEGVKKARVHERKPEGVDPKFKAGEAKKTQTIADVAKTLAKNTQAPTIAR